MTNQNADNKQIGGQHYKSNIECWNYIIANNLGYLEGTAIKYLTRWRKKNGIEDLRKAIHFIEKLIEVETRLPTDGVNRNELMASLQSAQYRSLYNGNSSRFCNVHAVAPEAGDSFPIPSGELNNIAILREDRV